MEESDRRKLVSLLMSHKHDDDPMTADDARLIVDLSAKIAEDVQNKIISTSSLVPQRLKMKLVTLSVKMLEQATKDWVEMIQDIISSKPSELMKDLEKAGFEVVAEGDGFVMMRGDKS